MKKIGYVLSGGGARGFAHLGILHFLDELGIKPHALSGTSAGAIVGSLYAAGISPVDILALMKKNSLFGWSNLSWKKAGFFSMDTLRRLLAERIGRDDFASLGMKLFVTSTDLTSGKYVIFSEGPLFQAVVASASIPVIFEPVLIGESYLVDGGLLNNFPTEPLEQECEFIIGSHVNKMENNLRASSVLHPVYILERCFHLAVAQAVYSKAGKCQVFIEPPLESYDMYDEKKADEIFDIGYSAALKQKAEILKCLDQ